MSNALSSAPREFLLRGQGLTKVYHMGEVKVHALQGVDIELFPGEFVVLLGASGSGKSTLLNILGGLDTASQGQLWYRNDDLSHADSDRLTQFRRDHVGFVFQMYNLLPRLTAEENVSLITEVSTNPMLPAKALELVGLANRKNHFPSQLSGGEQQRVAIARAIAKQPEILLCDEPTGALDFKTGILVLEAISKVNRELNTTTAVITHNASIADMADRVVHLADGKIAGITVNENRKQPSELMW
ncbi:MAG: ABC transporter ATP-binding protein [Pseudobdellovibrionaceae bacterium]|nr:ABC transporter ATP-binding protein [Bdellovibrionales bacterium]USN46560.1 MAG: ABC transporter ATP-binding protein [Pseudobdellovibrionaceae bacterium]